MLTFTDVLIKAGIDPKKVKLIRHALTDKNFKECYDHGMVYEYTCHQKADFSKGYEYWAVFISGSGTLAKFYSIYRVGASVLVRLDIGCCFPGEPCLLQEYCYRACRSVFHIFIPIVFKIFALMVFLILQGHFAKIV